MKHCVPLSLTNLSAVRHRHGYMDGAAEVTGARYGSEVLMGDDYCIQRSTVSLLSQTREEKRKRKSALWVSNVLRLFYEVMHMCDKSL